MYVVSQYVAPHDVADFTMRFVSQMYVKLIDYSCILLFFSILLLKIAAYYTSITSL